ncbi:restriction endonuclease subunit S [Brenneria izadpanahii]|uniref:Restriction endonuclease subunit S n=1 Tax=Brenneria izadpanahii TaxID=2722756 RepID=A0ABX7V1M4_9GAMM|nr:restriction endonuclease subunit S [Brenneria izadpanahii]QTF09694.1 restriction endonuclease subunit S [Brenneria izadpanahii]
MQDLVIEKQQSGAAGKVVPAGYKLTEVGVIPEDWECKYLGEFGDIVRGGSPRPAGDPRYFEGDFIPWLTVASLTAIPDAQQVVMTTSSMLTELGSKHSRTLEKDTLIISNSGATLGVAKLLGIKCCANDGVAAIINQRIGNKSFLIHYINTITKNLHDKVATGNGQPNLNTDLIRLIPVPFPKEKEQGKIAGTLSDCDNFILKLEKLIAKKQAIKTAAMQQLLTGKTRLPQFALRDDGAAKGYKKSELGEIPEDWVVYPFGYIMKIRHGKNQKDVECIDGKYPIYATGGQIGKANSFLYNKPSVLIGRKGTIDKPRYTNKPFWTVDTLFYSEISESADAKFIFYQFCTIDWMQYNEASGVPSLNASTIESIKTALPSVEEQTAIAAILSDMDKEIQTLQQRLEKNRQLKQGMMQELLTGKTRLIKMG